MSSQPTKKRNRKSEGMSDELNSDSCEKGEKDGPQIPECMCKECANTLDQIKDFHTHLSKMYAQMNHQNQSIQSQSQTLSKVFKELIPLLKGIDAKIKQTNGLLMKMDQ